MSDDLWVFGYGSLIWKADFPFLERAPAHIRGWDRRFWQGSTDHRGVPGKPGRVVTLIEAPESLCWGMAYRIGRGERDDVVAHLDHRERGGYDQLAIEIHLEEQSVMGMTYFATRENPNYLGHAEPAEIARQITRSEGPSGHNIDYLLQLLRSLEEMGVPDPHVASIIEHLDT